MVKKTIIGIIGGAGVAASNKLLELIEQEVTKAGAIRDCQHPEIILYQAVQSPSRSMFLEKKGPSFIPSYIEISQKLINSGATILCMSCNTAHYAISELCQAVSVPFIDLIFEVKKEVEKKSSRNVGLIASDGCLMGKVYDSYFDFPLILPDTNYQQLVTKGICNIKTKARFLPEDHEDRPKNIFAKICQHLKEKGADTIILGCTDIGVDYSPKHGEVDSLRVLASTIINSYYHEQ